jgi:hypothetical protein
MNIDTMKNALYFTSVSSTGILLGFFYTLLTRIQNRPRRSSGRTTVENRRYKLIKFDVAFYSATVVFI